MRPWDADYDVVQELTSIVDAHVEWYDALMGALLDTSAKLQKKHRTPSRTVFELVADYTEKGYWTPLSTEGILGHYESLLAAGDEIVKYLDKEKTPPQDLVRKFRELFVNFVNLINKNRDQTALTAFGYEPYSGIKNSKQAMIDLKKESERKIRLDQHFSVLLMRIENLHEMEELFGLPVCEKFVRFAGQSIENKLRIFDDMYRLDYNEFLLSIKLVDQAGAVLFARRIQKFFDDERNTVHFQGYDVQIKLSFCIAEPVANENFSQLIDHMREDLAKSRPEGSIIQYIEQPPIQRYIKSNA